METDRKWVVVRIDGRIAAISTDYAALAGISARLAMQKSPAYMKITAETVRFEQVWDIRMNARWEDIALFGTEFQKKVWKRLFDLTHEEDGSQKAPSLISYSDFADLCQNKTGVRTRHRPEPGSSGHPVPPGDSERIHRLSQRCPGESRVHNLQGR